MIEPPSAPSPSTWASHEQCLRAFEAAWGRGERPALEDYLPQAAADRAAVLIELVHLDLEYRLKAGEPARVEIYLVRYPELAQDAAVLVELLAAEFTQRRRREPALPIDEYAARFPECPDLLVRLGQYVTTIDHAPPKRDPLETATPWQTESALVGLPVVPGYEVLQRLGHGGMGVVYKARDLKLNRVVALKMIRAGAHAPEPERARFRQEAEAIARLHHPHLVQIFDVGEHDGLPFLSLEYVAGNSLEDRLRGKPFPPREAAVLTETLARAMHAAHLAQVIHRDLKPANVLLTADGTPKVTDFGLAKRLDTTGQTPSGAVLGTPSYMAPEQALGTGRAVGSAADIFALGGILYELLTGQPPFRGETQLETLAQVVGHDPVPPCRLRPQTPADLQTICLKCLHKEPARRYATALDLAEDLRRFLDGQPIRARPVGWPEQAWKWARRRPAVAILLGALVLSVAVGFAAVTWEWQRAEAQAAAKDEAYRREAEQRTKAEWQSYLTGVQLAVADLHRGRTLWAKEALDACPTGFREWEWFHLKRRCGEKEATIEWERQDAVSGVAFLPGGDVLASATGNGTVCFRDVTTGNVLRTLPGKQQHGINWIACNARGVLATAGEDGTVILWDNASGEKRLVYSDQRGQGPILCVVFQPGAPMLASANSPQSGLAPGEINIWDGTTGQTRWTLKGHQGGVTGLAFSPDGRILASSSYDGTVRLWNAEAGEPMQVLNEHTMPVAAVAFSPDGRWLVSAGGPIRKEEPDGEIVLRDLSGGRAQHLRRPNGRTVAVAFSPNSQRLATTGHDKVIRLWSVVTGQEILELEGHQGLVTSLAFSADGHCLASGSVDRTVRIWDGTPDERRRE